MTLTIVNVQDTYKVGEHSAAIAGASARIVTTFRVQIDGIDYHPDMGNIAFTKTGIHDSAFSISAWDGVLTYTPPEDGIAAIEPYETSFAISVYFTPKDGSDTLLITHDFTIAVNGAVDLPDITSDTAIDIDENNNAGVTVYTAQADSTAGAVAWSLTDSEDFAIDSATGAVTFNKSADHESQSSYSFTVIATNNDGAVEQTVTLSINDVVEAPVFTSGGSARIGENNALDAVVYTAAVSGSPAGTSVTYALTGTDASAFSIDENGVVTIAESADYETKTSYDFTITATNSAGQTTQDVTVTVANEDEVPTLTLLSSSDAVYENTIDPAIIARFTWSDPDGALGDEDLTIWLSGTGADGFEVNLDTAEGQIVLAPGSTFDYQNPPEVFLNIASISTIDGVRQSVLSGEAIAIPITILDTLEDGDDTLIQLDDLTTETTLGKVNFAGDGAYSVTEDGEASTNFIVDADGFLAPTDGIQAGTYTLTLTSGVDDQQAATITVKVNDLTPTEIVESVITEDTPAVDILSSELAPDLQGDELTFVRQPTAVSTASGLYVVDEEGTLTYTPDEEFVGVDTFEVEVTDDFGATTTQEVSITIAPDIDVTGVFTAREDNSRLDPTGRIALAARELTDYTATATAKHGKVTIDDDDGTWAYELDNTDAAVEALDGDDDDTDGAMGSLIDTVTITLATDDNSETLTRSFDIVIDGVTDYYGGTRPDDSKSSDDLAVHGVKQPDGLYFDYVHGSRGDDVLHGVNSRASLHGGDGNDWLIGGSMINHLYGGKGNDVYASPGKSGYNAVYLESVGNIDVDMSSSEKWKYEKETGAWTSGTGEGYEYIRAWIDTDNDRVLELADDEFDFIHQGFANITGGAGNDKIISGSGYTIINGLGGDDRLELKGTGQLLGGTGNDILIGNTGDALLHGGDGNDVLVAGLGPTTFVGGAGNDILDGSAGHATYSWEQLSRSEDVAIRLDLNDDVKWQQNDQGVWHSGKTPDFTHVQAWIDLDGDGIATQADEYDYLLDINSLIVRTASADNEISGGDGFDQLFGQSGNDIFVGNGGRDILRGGDGNDVLDGGAGIDTLDGGSGDDIFVLNLNGDANDWDNIRDFSSGTVSGNKVYNGTTRGGDDKIRVDIGDTTVTTLEELQSAANIRWTTDTSLGRSLNDISISDTIIYATQGTADTSDDVRLVVLEDFTAELTMAHFTTADIDITGALTAREDSPWLDPAGTITLGDPNRALADYTATTTASYGTVTINDDGTWGYVLDNEHAAVEALDGNDDDTDGAVGSLTDTVTITLTSGGETLTRSFDITIDGLTDYYLADEEFFLGDATLSDGVSLHGNAESARYNQLTGGSGDDVLHGLSADTVLYGGAGDDWLIGGPEDNYLYGGAGNDVYTNPTEEGFNIVYLESTGNINVNMGASEKWQYDKATDSWVSGAGDGYDYVKAWIDTDDDDARDQDDEYDFIHKGFANIVGGAGDDRIISGSGYSQIAGEGGDDWLELKGDGQILAGAGNDVLIAGTGETFLRGGAGDDRFDGNAAGHTTYDRHHSARDEDAAIHLDMNDATKWQQDDQGAWTSGTGAGFTYIRAWIDLDGDGEATQADEFDYLRDIDSLIITAASGGNEISGGDGYDHLYGGDGIDVFYGNGGTDQLYGQGGNDRLDGGAGDDNLAGGTGNDVFVLNLDGAAGDLDYVEDFSSGTVSGASYFDGTARGGNDKISVDIGDSTVTTLAGLKAAANIRWTNNTNEYGFTRNETHDRFINDTIIYATHGTADTSDDTILMVLEDFDVELTLAHFTTADIDITGTFAAREDSPWRNPDGTISLGDPNRALSDYTATATASYGTVTINDDGTWGYVLDNEHAAVEALDGDDDDTDGAVGSLTDTVTITLTSGDETLTRSFDITIDGLTDYTLAEDVQVLDEHKGSTDDLSLHSDSNWGRNDVYGGSGDDVLDGGYGSRLFGGAGDDWLIAGPGANHLYGGAGSDVYTSPGGRGTDVVFLESEGKIIDLDMSASEKWKYEKATDSWVSGTGDGYEYIRAWIHAADDTVRDDDDEYDYIHQGFRKIQGGAGNDNIITGAAHSTIFGRGGDDELEVTVSGTLYGDGGDDVLIAGSGRTHLDGGYGDDVFDGSAGYAIYGWSHAYRSGDVTLHLDMTDETKWKQDDQGTWTSGTSDDFTHIRAWIDLDNDGIATQADEYDYLLGINRLYIFTSSSDHEISGSSGNDSISGDQGNNDNDIFYGNGGHDALYGGGGDDLLDGGSGNDHLYGGYGNDVLAGGVGVDHLHGYNGNDIFVLNLNGGARDWDEVHDFSSGTASGNEIRHGRTSRGDDKIRVDIGDSYAATLEALKSAANIRWTTDTTRGGLLNDRNINDTIIYATHGTETTSDDTILMVLEDYTAPLTLAHFDIVSTAPPVITTAIDITGTLTAREDSPWFDPAGTITLADDRALADYTATSTASYGTLTINDDGTWAYVLDNTNAAVEALDGDDDDTDGAAGSLIDTVTITLTSGDETLTHSFDITIDGLTDYYLTYGSTTLDYKGSTDDLSLHGLPDVTFQNTAGTELHGGSGDDVLDSSFRYSYVYGGAGDDWFTGGYLNNFFFGGAGNDVYASSGVREHDHGNAAILGSVGNITVDMTESEKWKYNKATATWVSGTGDEYEYIRAWIDTDNDDLLEQDDEFDFIHQDFFAIMGGDDSSDKITWGSGRIAGDGGDDTLELKGSGIIWGDDGNDILIAGSGSTSLRGGEGNDEFDGSAGTAIYSWDEYSPRSEDVALYLDLNDDVKWKKDAQGVWTSGKTSDFTYVRAWVDLDNDGIVEQDDEFDYLLDIDSLSIYATSANDEIFGGDSADKLSGNGGNDTLSGNGGIDRLSGGRGNDIFILNLSGLVDDLDRVVDFSSSANNSDKIRVDIGDSTATTLAELKSAANIDWTVSTQYNTARGWYSNHSPADTVIYATQGTADTSDDVTLMVLEDFNARLTLAHFDIVSTAPPPPPPPVIDVTGSFTAREDSPWSDPAGTITLADDRTLADYTATSTASYGTLTINDDGTWGYVLDNTHADVEALDGDDDDTDGAVGSLTDTVTITLTSGDETLTRSFDITIDGLTDYYLTGPKWMLNYRTSTEEVSLHGKVNHGGWDYLYGGSGDDVLHSVGNITRLYGREGDDWLIGSTQHNHLYGGTGNDVYMNPSERVWGTVVYLESEGNINMDMSALEKWKYDRTTDSWDSGTGDGYEYIRAWIDTDNDGVLELNDDEFDFIHQSFNKITGGADNDKIISGSRSHALYGEGGDDRLEITDEGRIFGGAGDDVLIAGSGRTKLVGGSGNDIFDGSAGESTYSWDEEEVAIQLDINDEVKWKQDAQGVWTSGTSADFTYVRAWIDLDGDGVLELDDDEFDYLLGIHRLDIDTTSANSEISGGAGNDRIYGKNGNDIFFGNDGDDTLHGHAGNDVLDGGAGEDNLFGGGHNDIFVLNLNGAAGDRDNVVDFSFDTVSSRSSYSGHPGGTDKIRVDTDNGNETTLDALKSAANIRWTNDTTQTGKYTNREYINDTIIYATQGTSSTADDVILMVLEDYTEELTLAHFDIV